MKVIGLTGGIASGKSTVTAMLRELGARVIDSDVLAREVVAPGTPGLREVVAAFGPGVLTPEGELDRKKLAGLVFGDGEARARLNAIVHPRVRERLAGELERAAGDGLPVVVLDVPLLIETGLRELCQQVWVV
ncbi:MAG: dephospho-CoA kinase, partial [Firmicutes bacterium]|nr:dephospho-CoA kinase [Bacillota bacterium]